MIQKLTSLDSCTELMHDVNRDTAFSDPRLLTQDTIAVNLYKAVEKPDHHVLGVFHDGVMTGLFVFLITEDERYIEMLFGLSRFAAAYEEIAEYLQANYPGFQADFVFNPSNTLLRELLTRIGASFYEEQQKMVLSNPCPTVDTNGIEPLTEQYKEQYIAMHDTDCYWTGDKVAQAPERFSVFLAVDHGLVVGYLDVTNCFEENEPFDFMVKEAYRRRGWGRKLLVKAIEANRPKGMALLVDVGNIPAIKLYESAGFVKVQGENSLTAAWNIK